MYTFSEILKFAVMQEKPIAGYRSVEIEFQEDTNNKTTAALEHAFIYIHMEMFYY